MSDAGDLLRDLAAVSSIGQMRMPDGREIRFTPRFRKNIRAIADVMDQLQQEKNPDAIARLAAYAERLATEERRLQ